MYPVWLKFEQWVLRGYRKCNKPLRRIDTQNGGQKWLSLRRKSSIDAGFDKWSILCRINNLTNLILRLILFITKNKWKVFILKTKSYNSLFFSIVLSSFNYELYVRNSLQQSFEQCWFIFLSTSVSAAFKWDWCKYVVVLVSPTYPNAKKLQKVSINIVIYHITACRLNNKILLNKYQKNVLLNISIISSFAKQLVVSYSREF